MASLRDLFKPQTMQQLNDAFPQETAPGYYTDTSVNVVYEPPITADTWAPTIAQNVPQRGVGAEHGVPADSSAIDTDETPKTDPFVHPTDPDEVPDVEKAPVFDPVHVVVDHIREQVGVDIKTATNAVPLTSTVDAGLPLRIMPKRDNRVQVFISWYFTNLNVGNVFIGDESSLKGGTGFFVPPNTIVSLPDTTEELSAALVGAPTGTTVTVTVLEVFSVRVDDKVV